MTHFLWVEDFKASETNREDNIISSTVNLVFGSVLDAKNKEFEDEYEARDFLEEKGIFLKLNLLEALAFIHNPDELAKVDFVVLDVDMPLMRDGQLDSHNYLPPLIKQYQSEAELKKIAGYQIYIDLVIELGFPKSHILFCSNHAGYFEQFVEKFESSNIKFPPLLQKEHDKEIKNWLTDAQSDYFVLRRGIIEACQYLKTSPIRFNTFIKDAEKKVNPADMHDYLDVLENFLPLREPTDKAALYKLFIRTLTHEWEAAEANKSTGLQEIYAFASIMKTARNWIAHSNIFNNVNEQDIAFLFICNMRAMFELSNDAVTYETNLLNLFSKPLEASDFNKKIGKAQQDRDLPLSKYYILLLEEAGKLFGTKTWETDFHNVLKNLQKDKANNKSGDFFIEKLYQCFWFLTSNGYIYTPKMEYQFSHFKYGQTKFLLEFSRRIYNRSFP